MSFTPNFSVAQSSADVSVIALTDTSTDFPSISVRLVYLRKYDGSYLVPQGTATDYIVWNVVSGVGDTLEIDAIDKDYCLDITIIYYTGSSITDSKTILTLLTGYGDFFLGKLTQALAGNKVTITQQNFWVNKNKLRVLLDDASQAVSLLNDQTIAQFALDDAKPLVDNISSFF